MARKVGVGTAIFILSLCVSLEAAELRIPGSFSTIQEAIDAATKGDIIIVANGTYSGDGNRDLDFGGKAITVRSAKGAAKCTINCGGTDTEPHRGFIFENGEGANSVVDGFTITNGYVSATYPDGAGGAIFIDGAGPTIQNCVINGNTTQGDYSSGGGIVCYDGDPIIRNCTITHNQSDAYGGGIFCERADAVIENCVITHNTVTGDYGNYSNGGGIACWAASPAVTDCSIQDNVARYGGGVVAYNESSPQVNDCVIQNNHATYGGGVYIDDSTGVRFSQCTIRNNSVENDGGGLYFNNSDPNVTSCLVQGNTATQYGGGIYAHDCTITVRGCEVLSNMAEGSCGGGLYYEYSNAAVEDTLIENNSSLQSGGGFHYYEYEGPATLMMRNCIIVGNRSEDDIGGVTASRPASVEITNCLIAGNRAEGIVGAMKISSPAATVRNCTIFGNSAGVNYGGLYFTYNSDMTMSNCIVWGNSDGGSGYEIAVLTSANPSTLSVSHSCIEQGQASVEVATNCALDWGEGNIQSEPNFVSPGYWDDNDTPGDPSDDIWVLGCYYLLPGSDCIDAGDPNGIEIDETDLAGNDRIAGADVDTGAYENDPTEIGVTKVTVKADKDREDPADICTIAGNFVAAVESFLAADTVSLRTGTWYETLSAASFRQSGKKSKYTYKGPSGGITSMTLDFVKGIFSASGKDIDLSGMTAPLPVALVMGDYYGYATAADEGANDVINSKKSLPVQLLSGNADTLQVTKMKAKEGPENYVSSLIIQGTLTSIETVDLTATGLTIHWGTDSHTIAGKYFTEKGTDKYVGKKKSFAADPNSANVTIDFIKCTFKIVLKNTTLTWQDAPATFGLEFGSYNKVASAVLGATSRYKNEKIGTVIFLSFEGGFYGIVSDAGEDYDPINLPAEFAQDGQRIRFQAIERPDLFGVHQWGVIIEITEISAL